MWSILSRFLDRICSVAGALLFSQFPQFLQQYTQRLSGHLAELSIQIEHLRQVALLSGKSLPVYIQKFISHPDIDISRQGELMKAMVDRQEVLRQAVHAIEHASAVERPWVFFSYLQPDIAKGTLATFQPGLSFSVEASAYAFIGIIVGYLLYSVIYKTLARLTRLGRAAVNS